MKQRIVYGGVKKRPIIAIDGPSGAGKSTVARIVAEKLNYVYIDTGAMYRALTWKALKYKVNLEDSSTLSELARQTKILIVSKPGQPQKVFCDGEDLSDCIRTPEIDHAVPLVAKVPGVREEMQKIQKEIAQDGGVVMDGRDISSRVLPQAEYKFFLTASIDKRVERRARELVLNGYTADLTELKTEMLTRDRLDSERAVGPLIQVPEAKVIDSSELHIDAVVQEILKTVYDGGEE